MKQQKLWMKAVDWAEKNCANTNDTIWYFETVLGGDYQAYRKWEIKFLETR